MSGARPLIGIPMRHEVETERFYLQRYYAEAVEAAGGLPVQIPLVPRAEYVAALVSKLGGVLLPGSASDVDPSLYGSEPREGLGAVHPLRDATDRLVLEEAERLGMPLLAICYGMQAWNVWRGGTLIQDIATEVREAVKHQQGAPRDRRSHRVKILNASRLALLAASETAWVNSHHHQALSRLGEGLTATAWTSDGLVEAVEDFRGGRWALGVQWHPEIAWAEDELSKAIFGDFVEAARRHAPTPQRDFVTQSS